MAPSKKAAAAKKAAATRAAKKEAAAAAAGSVEQQQEMEQEQPEQAGEAAEAGASEQPEDSRAEDTVQSTRKSRRGAAAAAAADAAADAAAPAAATRTSRRGKAAVAVAAAETELEPRLEDEPQSVNKMEQPATTASVTEGKPPVDAADAKPAKAPASKAAPAADMTAESSSAGSTSLPDSLVATTSTHGHSMVDSVMTAASGAPDILGVVEAREDEDLAVDDTEPPPMDREEERRLRERPANAHVSAEAMPPLAESGSMPRAQQATASRMQAQLEERREVNEPIGQLAGIQEPQSSGDAQGEEADGDASLPGSREDRMARMNALRKRMNDSAQANRREVIAAQNEHRAAIAESKRLERKRKQAEAMGEKLDALETGEDLERKRNWEYSLEDNERWTKKQDRKERRADHGFKDFDESARRKYKRDIDTFKPDLEAYRKQREAAIEYGLAVEGSTSSMAIEGPSGSGSREVVQGSSAGGQMIPGGELLYRDASSFVYADHKPSDDAIDRVVGQINQDIDKRSKRSRVRVEDDSDITYINDKNKVFNKKLERYFNKYTSEIKNNFERGTAL